MRTSVAIQGLQVYGLHGLFAEERSLGQKFVFNVRCDLAETDSHLNDQLERSVGYDALVNLVADISQSQQFNTVEALAETVARSLLVKHPIIDVIHVSVAKLSPPIAHVITSATVEISLKQDKSLPA